MKELTPDEIEALILGYEDLETEDRTVADACLSAHPELAARLRRHQEREQLARRALPLDHEPELDPADEAEQRESLRRILTEVAAGDCAIDESRGVSRSASGAEHSALRSLRWALPVAAVLALVFFWPRDTIDDSLLWNLGSITVETADDPVRGGEPVVVQGGDLRSGQAFALEFDLRERAWVVVYHVDPRGRASRVHPEQPIADLVPFEGGRHRIPAAGGEQTWILGADTGVESFLVAVSREAPLDFDRLSFDEAPGDRALTLDELNSRLREFADQVVLHEFRHID